MIPEVPESDNDFLNLLINKPKLMSEWGGNVIGRFKKLYYKEPLIPVNEQLRLLRHKIFLAVDAVGLPRDYVGKLGGVSKNTFYDIARYTRTPTLGTIYKISCLLQINPIVLFITESDIKTYQSIIKSEQNDLNIDNQIIKKMHELLNTKSTNNYNAGLDLFKRNIQKFVRQLQSQSEIWPAKIGFAFGVILSDKKEDILTCANVAILLSKNYYI